MDDEAFFGHWGCEHSRRDYIAKVVAYRPAVIVGDWNAHASLETEEEIYSLDSDYVKRLVSHAGHRAEAYRKAWLEWRHSPFQILKQDGYELAWPSQATAVRGDLAVDGFAYDPAQCQADEPHVAHFLTYLTDHAGIVATFQIQSHAGRQGSLLHGPERALSHLVRRPTKLKHRTAPIGVVFKATNCDLHDDNARSCFAESSPMSKKQRRTSAASHVLLTGPMGLPSGDVETPYASFSGSLTEALAYGIKHSMKYIWRYCPRSHHGIHDIRSQTGIRRLNRMLPEGKEVATHQGHKVGVAWAKYKNLDSGINFDQVLVPRELIQRELPRVAQAEITSPMPRAVEKILEKQNSLNWYDEENGVHPYYPQSVFIKAADP